MGDSGSILILCRALREPGLPPKKRSKHVAERDTPEVREKRREFREEIVPIGPGRLVFVDETGVTTAMTPSHGRAPRGERFGASTPASWVVVAVEWVIKEVPRDFGFLRGRWCPEAVAILMLELHHFDVGRETVRRWLPSAPRSRIHPPAYWDRFLVGLLRP